MLTAKQLVTLGISENEGKVYLAALEMGQATAQEVARKTGLSRVTTYAMIESLTSRGLISSLEKEGKRYFSAESPERLKSLLHSKKVALEEKERELDSFMPELKALAAGAKEKPTVRFYEGMEGLISMRQDLLRFRNIRLQVVQAKDDYYSVVPVELRKQQNKSLTEHGVRSRTIFTFREPFIPPEGTSFIEFHQVPKEQFPFSGEIAIYDDRVSMVTYKTRPIGVIIHSKDLAQTMRAFYDLAWEGSGEYSKK